MGVAPPAKWHLQFWNGEKWLPVAHPSGYPVGVDSFMEVHFDTVTTSCLRAALNASGQSGQYAALAVAEWEALAPANVDPATLPAPPTGESFCKVKD
jgi:hypothetical protein